MDSSQKKPASPPVDFREIVRAVIASAIEEWERQHAREREAAASAAR
jgi:hypothetical protein